MSASESTADAVRINTFRFTEQDRALILSQVSTTDLLEPDTGSTVNDAQSRLESLRKKELTLQLHANTLAEYIKAQRIPRGLRTNLTPNLLTDDQDFVTEWYGLCNAFSLDLMFLTIKHLHDKITVIQEQINSTERELKDSLPELQYTEVTANLTESLQKLKENILKVKKRKFERDNKDYLNNQVYTWNRKKPKQEARQASISGRTPDNRQPLAENSTDSGDSSASEHHGRRAFLGRTVPNREGQGSTPHTAQPARTQQRPVTRAWTTRGRGRGHNRR